MKPRLLLVSYSASAVGKALSNNIIKKTFRESPYSLRLSTCTLSSDSSAIVFDDAAADK